MAPGGAVAAWWDEARRLVAWRRWRLRLAFSPTWLIGNRLSVCLSVCRWDWVSGCVELWYAFPTTVLSSNVSPLCALSPPPQPAVCQQLCPFHVHATGDRRCFTGQCVATGDVSPDNAPQLPSLGRRSLDAGEIGLLAHSPRRQSQLPRCSLVVLSARFRMCMTSLSSCLDDIPSCALVA